MQILWTSDTAGIYIPVHTSWFCIGYDGLGAVDGVKSDVTTMTGTNFSETPVFEEMLVVEVQETPQIYMRRAVRRFDYYHDYKHNLLILSERAFGLVGRSLESAVDGFRPVECHFGSWSGKFSLAKLKRQSVRGNKSIVLSDSTFLEAKSLSSKQSQVEKRERDMMDESHVIQRGLRFETALEIMNAEDFSTDILLDEATLDFPEVAMFNYKAGVSYLSLSIYQQLLTLKHPQRQVLGIVGSQPFAKVHFSPVSRIAPQGSQNSPP